MKAQIIHSIHSDLEEIKDLFDYYKETPDNIPDIELDISLSKFRDIYQQLLQLKKMQSSEPAESAVQNPQQEKQLEEEQEDPHLENIDQASDETEVEEEPTEDEEASVSSKNEEAPSEDIASQPKQSKKSPGQKIISDKYQEHNQSVGDSLGKKQTTKDVSQKMKNQPIGDLQKAFGINDRFLYTKELFNGNRAQFNETIDELNQANNLDDALAYINNQFDWDPDNEYRQGLIHLLERKFQG